MNLAEFARWVLETSTFDGSDLDGGDVQDKALECGVIVETNYDPAIHGETAICEVKPGDPWFVFSDEFKASLNGTGRKAS